MIMIDAGALDLTARAEKAGWTLPDGWEVEGFADHDPDVEPTDYDCYDQETIDEFNAGEWTYVYVGVQVLDENGETRGSAGIGGVEHGRMGELYLDALDLDNGRYSPILEYGLIDEALEDAARELERLGRAAITKKVGA
jgi:hypothetical protein